MAAHQLEEVFSASKPMKADRDANFIEKNEQGVTVNRWLATGMLCALRVPATKPGC